MTIIRIFLLAFIFLCCECAFIKQQGTHFTLNNKNFYFAGTNTYNLFTLSNEDIVTRFGELKKNNIKVLRTWAFSHEDWKGFEPKKGQYNEEEFKVFDFIMKTAADHGIWVIITLENYWPDYGGIVSRLKWEGLPTNTNTDRAKFYMHPGCKEGYKNYVKHFVTRKNTITGIDYKDDPYIFSWELMNEPRYQDAGEDNTGITLRKWTDEMAAYIKSMDPNHMVSLGIEGHEKKYHYGGDEGNPFVYLHQSPYINFATGHMYPDEDWDMLNPEQAARVVAMWLKDATSECKKPFVLEEFNSHKTQALYWNAMFKVLENFDGAGDAFWGFMGKNECNHEFCIYDGHPIFEQSFNAHAKIMNNKY